MGKKMKKVFATTLLLTLVLSVVSSGTNSDKGGNIGKGEGFKISVPTFDTNVKQGETQNVTVSVDRGESFKQDVTLKITLSKGEGISFDPSKVVVKAGDKAEAQFMISVPKNAALGEYTISVTGTPTTGEPTSVEFTVNVVAPEAGYTMQSDSDKGGSTVKGESFKIAVPTFATKIKQGETQIVIITLERGESFKQNVTLEISLAKGEGITFNPDKVVVKASDKSEVQITISALKSAALGEYTLSIKGTPETGNSTSTEFNITVVAP